FTQISSVELRAFRSFPTRRSSDLSRASASVPTEIFPALSAVRFAPLPLKVPLTRLLTFVRELTPLKVLEPVKIWFPFSNDTLPESRGADNCPQATLHSSIASRVQS